MLRKELILGGGCFWCMEAIFELLNGVKDVVNGYANGHSDKEPNYRSVCSGETGYAEVIKITYNPNIIKIDDLLEIFFELHNPTTLNRQGSDIGTQYRSTILYSDKETKESALKIKELAQSIYNDKIITKIELLDKFYLAEDYHQDYFRLNSNQGYCKVVISPKVLELREKYSKLLQDG